MIIYNKIYDKIQYFLWNIWMYNCAYALCICFKIKHLNNNDNWKLNENDKWTSERQSQKTTSHGTTTVCLNK